MGAGEDDSVLLDETLSVAGDRQLELGRLRWARVQVVHPPELVTTIDLPHEGATLGRTRGSSVPPLRSKTVSREHLRIEWEPGRRRYRARDLGSRNGAHVDGARLDREPCTLEDGSVLRVGDVLLVFEWGMGANPPTPTSSRDAAPGRSRGAAALRAALARAAPDPSPALLIGDSGTGKEHLAAEIHALSGRTGPLVTTNCAALGAQVIESQLFGHERGAFTGATSAHKGLFRAADGGSLFLDEIGEMPLEMQPKLLRAIQHGELQPVGRAGVVRVDVRVIAATNRDLRAEVERGGFRRDLYARLSLCEIHVPSLDARRADIIMWIDRLHERWCATRGRATTSLRLSADAAEALLLARWPENLRGLDRLVHELGSADGEVGFHDLPAWLTDPEHAPDVSRARAQPSTAPPSASEPSAPRKRQPAPPRTVLVETLRRNDWSVRATAKELGKERRQIYRWMKAYDIDPERMREGD